MLNRRMLLAAPAAFAAAAAMPRLAGAELNPDGLHRQPFFVDSFLDMAEDRSEAEAAGKNFAVFFEQPGCPYCREMHEVNLVRPEILDYVAGNFSAVQINIWGSRAVTDFDGEELEERALARKWGVAFTPTISFFGREPPAEAKSGRDLEVARMPGYFKPFHFVTMFEFVREARYKDTDFQRFIHEKVEKIEAGGGKVDIWN